MYNNIFSEKTKYYNSKLYYAHIPKTAGTYTKDFLYGVLYNSVIDHGFSIDSVYSLSNISDHNSKFFFKNYFDDFNINKPLVFSTFRNPFDLLCSYYMHKRTTGMIHNGWMGCNDYHKFKSFKEFIIGFADPSFTWHLPILNNFLLSQLFDSKGKCLADFIITYENLNNNLKLIKYSFLIKQFKNFGLKDDLRNNNFFINKFKDILKTYKNILLKDYRKKIRKSKNKINDFRYYYDNEMIDCINEKCSRELNLFGYAFEKNNFENAILKNEGGFFDPSQINYNISNDKMKIINA